MIERRGAPPRVVDGLLVAVSATVAVVGLFGPAITLGVRPTASVALALPLALAQAVALWWRRAFPVGVLAATLLAVVLAQAVGDVNAASFLGPHVAAYTVGVRVASRRSLAAAAVFAVAVGADVIAVRGISGRFDPVLYGATGALVVVAWGLGRYVAVRRAYVDAVVAYAQQLESEQEERARRAVVDERGRIARELHDQVAHHLGVISLQTAAARRWLGRDQERVASALGAAERAARTALETMPTILQALRNGTPDADRAPLPSLGGLEALVEGIMAGGIEVELSVSGDRRPLHPTVELTAYRIVQEALTNVIKHAGDARARVSLEFGAERLEIEVADDGHGLAAASANGAGLGLRGMRERVELIGGELDADGNPGGGFRVRASLPVSVPQAAT